MPLWSDTFWGRVHVKYKSLAYVNDPKRMPTAWRRTCQVQLCVTHRCCKLFAQLGNCLWARPTSTPHHYKRCCGKLIWVVSFVTEPYLCTYLTHIHSILIIFSMNLLFLNKILSCASAGQQCFLSRHFCIDMYATQPKLSMELTPKTR